MCLQHSDFAMRMNSITESCAPPPTGRLWADVWILNRSAGRLSMRGNLSCWQLRVHVYDCRGELEWGSGAANVMYNVLRTFELQLVMLNRQSRWSLGPQFHSRIEKSKIQVHQWDNKHPFESWSLPHKVHSQIKALLTNLCCRSGVSSALRM